MIPPARLGNLTTDFTCKFQIFYSSAELFIEAGLASSTAAALMGLQAATWHFENSGEVL